MPYENINGLNMYYEIRGQGPVLTFAHGASGNRLMWWQQLPYFTKNYTCLTFDHRGWGSSLDTTTEVKANSFSSDLKTLLDRLKITTTSLICQSMGGITGLNFALEYPKRINNLVLADTTGGIGDPSIVNALTNVSPPDHPTQRALTEHFIKTEPSRTLLYEQIGLLNPPRERSAVSSIFRNLDGPSAKQLRSFATPTLFIVGDQDLIFPPEIISKCHDLVPNSKLEVIENGAHACHFEHPDIFNNHVTSFLQQNK